MARRGYKSKVEYATEFDLDLAPLLAVMVKLVPVLLISSAFVQLMIVESELPQLVKEAIAQQDEKTPARVMLEMTPEKGFEITLREENGTEKTTTIPMKEQTWDFAQLHAHLVQIKKSHPAVFKLEFSPSEKVTYQDVIRATDEARKSRDPANTYQVKDAKTGQTSTTDYMFPEVTFANMLEG